MQLAAHMNLYPVGLHAELRTWSDVQRSLNACSKEGTEQSTAES
jgi:hypothetical protein